MTMTMNIHRVAGIRIYEASELAAPGDPQYPDGLYVTRVAFLDSDGFDLFNITTFGVESGTAPVVSALEAATA